MRPSPIPLVSTETKRKGFALVVVLAVLVLLLGLVMAYFSRATLQRQISATSASSTEAELLAQAAFGTIMNDFVNEIDSGSQPESAPFANASVHLKRPNIVADPITGESRAPTMAPQRSGDEGIANLLKVSRRNTPFFTNAPGFNASTQGATRGAAISTDTPSRNGIRFTKERWNLPKLMNDAELATFTIPDWIYLMRTGTTPTEFSATTLPALRNHSPENDQFVIGRFAYVVYDVGGLIDINVVGNLLDVAENKIRGRLHQVSLTDGLGDAALPNFSSFVGWRWPSSSTNSSSTNGGLFDPKRTFLDAASGEQALVSRQDMIRYTSRAGSPIPASRLPYLTTFSRDVNAPAYSPDPNGPVIPAAYFNAGDTPQSELNPDLLGDSVRFSEDVVLARPNEPTKAPRGSPVIPRRFPLNKLSLLAEQAPDANQLSYYFGLERQSDGSFLYDTARINGRLASLEKVAAFRDGTIPDPTGSGTMLPKAREPNFFEILQGVIAAGSLGKSGSSPEFTAKLMGQTGMNFDQHNTDNTWIRAHPVDALRVRQVLQIGANLIDQWDANDIPTTIRYPSGVPNQFIEVYGVENLPYITQISVTPYRPNYAFDGANPRDCLQVWALFDVWNPHQNAATPAGITNFRIIPSSGTTIDNTSPSLWIQNAIFPPGSTQNALWHDGFSAIHPQTDTRYDGGTSHVERTLSGYNSEGKPIPGTVITKTLRALNDQFQLELRFPPASYSEPVTVGSGEPTRTGDVPGVLLTHHNLSTVPIQTTPLLSKPNAAIPRKSERPKNLQKTINYWYDMGTMFPYQAWVGPTGSQTAVRLINPTGTGALTNFPPGTSELRASAYETEGPGGERLYPVGTVFEFPPGTLPYWSVEPPLTFSSGSTRSDPTTAPTTVYARMGTKAHNYIRSSPRNGFPYAFDLQGQVNGTWVTYQRVEGVFSLGQPFQDGQITRANLLENTHHSEAGATLGGFYQWMGSNAVYGGAASYTKADPRSVRFGLSETTYNSMGAFLRRVPAPWTGVFDAAQPQTWLNWVTPRGGYLLGKNVISSTRPSGYNPPASAPGFEHFWPTSPVALYGLISNDPTTLNAERPMRYSDIDGVIRPADGFWGALPTIPARTADRPVILNRPFRGVGEMGYVFRDTPWKSLDFSTKWSGDLGLLDVFSLDETTGTSPLVAGKVNLNTRQEAVLATLLRGTYKQDGVPEMTAAQAIALAAGIVAESKKASFRDRGEFVRRVLDRSGTNDILAADIRKTEREAAVRALGEIGSTRTWNLMVDLVAQAGRLTTAANSESDFIVRAEHRVWIHVAIDRITGEVVSVQREKVKE